MATFFVRGATGDTDGTLILTTTKALGANSQRGNTYLVCVTWNPTGSNAISLSDNAVGGGNAYTQIGPTFFNSTNTTNFAIFKATNIVVPASGVTTVTATFGANASFTAISFLELLPTDVDGTNFESNFGVTSGTAANNVIGTSLTPSADNCEFFTFAQNDDNSTPAVTVGTTVAWVSRTTTSTNVALLAESFPQTTKAAVTPTARIALTATKYVVVAVVMKAIPFVPLSSSPSGRRRVFRPLRRSKSAQPVPVSVPQPAPTPPQVIRARRPFRPRPRSEFTTPVPTVVVTTQALPPQGQTRRLLGIPHRKTSRTVPVQITVTVPLQPVRDRFLSPSRRRRSSTQVPLVGVAPQVTATPLITPRRRSLIPPRVRARQAQPVPAAVVVVTTQGLPPQGSRRVQRPWLPRQRSETANLVPVGAVVVTVQALPPQPGRRRWPPPPRRHSVVAQPVVTVTVQVPQSETPRRRPVFKSHTRTSNVPPAPVVAVTTVLVPQPGRRRLFPLLRRRTAPGAVFTVSGVTPTVALPIIVTSVVQPTASITSTTNVAVQVTDSISDPANVTSTTTSGVIVTSTTGQAVIITSS